MPMQVFRAKKYFIFAGRKIGHGGGASYFFMVINQRLLFVLSCTET